METLRRLKRFYWPNKHLFILSILCLIGVTGVTLVYPLFLKITIDDVIGNAQYHLVPWIAGGFIALMVMKGFLLFIHQYFGDLFGVRAVYALRGELYKKLQFLSFHFYDNAKTGDLMSRLAGDVEVFRFFLSFGFAQLLNFILLTGIGFFIMLTINWKLALVSLVALPFVGFAVYRFDKRVHPAFRKIRQSFSHLTTRVQENISGMNTVKALSREDFEIGRFLDKNEGYRTSNLENAKVWSTYFPLMEWMGNISVVILLLFGGYLVIRNELKIGELIAFFSLIWYIIGPLMWLGFVMNTFAQTKAAGERLLEILDEKDEMTDDPETVSVDRIEGHVQFKDVTHRYKGNEIVLDSISFDAPPGKVIGIIGATGSGKTTIVRLISRFYEPEKGEILIDDRPIRSYPLSVLRKHIGVVFQESFLFSSTVKDNIAYGKPDATMEEIIEAAKRAEAHDFIMEFPDGYETLLGERGLGLSGGQKQRIAIARALLINPSILILDDASSAVDMETEFKIQRALREVMKGRTTFIIAHRISSVKDADEILVLDQGKVVERGTHEELLAIKDGIYRRIYEIQFKDRFAVMNA